MFRPRHFMSSSARPHPHLYEINTWVWLDELSRRHGRTITLGGVPDEEWDRLRDLGFDLVYLMGVWERSLAGRTFMRTHPPMFPDYDRALPGWTLDDVVGSPYSVRAYVPDAHIGTADELRETREKLHRRGMRLILDFVPNHTGWDHAWATEHPDYYVQASFDDFRREPTAFLLVERDDEHFFLAHGRDPYFAPWRDTLQLNYFNPAAREALLAELANIARWCDGARCDMSMLVVNEVFAKTWGRLVGSEIPQEEFWPKAVAALPGFLWLAEVYWDMEWRMQELGFDFTYDKRLYDRLLHSSPADVRGHLSANLHYQQKMARFLENHDEPRAMAEFGNGRLRAAATVAGTLPGLRFYHQGQFEGRKLRVPVMLSRAADEAPDRGAEELYRRLLRVTDDDAFHDADWHLLTVEGAGDSTFTDLVAYEWIRTGARRVVIVNLGRNVAQGNVALGGIRAGTSYVFADELDDRSYTWRGADLITIGLYVRLEGFGAHLFSVSATKGKASHGEQRA